jgi:hypothetical protein
LDPASLSSLDLPPVPFEPPAWFPPAPLPLAPVLECVPPLPLDAVPPLPWFIVVASAPPVASIE